MSDAYVGLATTLALDLVAPDGTVIQTAAGTVAVTGPDAVAIFTGRAFVHQGGGHYTVGVLAGELALPGEHTVRWSGTPDTVLPWVTTLDVGVNAAGNRRRGELVEEVMDRVGDLWEGAVTAADASTLTDPDLSTFEDNHWQGAYAYVTSGASRGQERRVARSAGALGQLTFGRQWGGIPQAGDAYHLTQRWPTARYVRLLNQAIDDVAGQAMITTTDESLTLTNSTSYLFAIPARLVNVAAVWWRSTVVNAAQLWTPYLPKEWDVIPERRLLQLHNPKSNTRLRLVGQREPDRLADDYALCEVPASYLIPATAALLYEGSLAAPGLDLEQAQARVNLYRELAKEHWPRVQKLPGAKRV